MTAIFSNQFDLILICLVISVIGRDSCNSDWTQVSHAYLQYATDIYTIFDNIFNFLFSIFHCFVTRGSCANPFSSVTTEKQGDSSTRVEKNLPRRYLCPAWDMWWGCPFPDNITLEYHDPHSLSPYFRLLNYRISCTDTTYRSLKVFR